MNIINVPYIDITNYMTIRTQEIEVLLFICISLFKQKSRLSLIFDSPLLYHSLYLIFHACITNNGVSVWNNILRAMDGLNIRARIFRR